MLVQMEFEPFATSEQEQLLVKDIEKMKERTGLKEFIQREKTHAVFFSPDPNIEAFTRPRKCQRPLPTGSNSISFPNTAEKINSNMVEFDEKRDP